MFLPTDVPMVMDLYVFGAETQLDTFEQRRRIKLEI